MQKRPEKLPGSRVHKNRIPGLSILASQVKLDQTREHFIPLSLRLAYNKLPFAHFPQISVVRIPGGAPYSLICNTGKSSINMNERVDCQFVAAPSFLSEEKCLSSTRAIGRRAHRGERKFG